MQRSVAMCGVALACLAAAPAYAQTTQPTQAVGLEEVVVTAQRRAENLQDVPIAVNAFSAQNLTAQGITDSQKLETVTPGLVFSTFNGAGHPYIRGIGADQLSVAGDSAVAIYVDGVYRPTIYALNQDFFDIERVEVLKGPQGTLYGRNSTGGAINMITRDPVAGFNGAALVAYGTHKTVHAGAYLNGGTERVAASASVYFSGHKGLQRNLFDGSRSNDKQTLSLRGKLKVGLDEAGDWSLVLAGDLSRDHGKSNSAFTYLSANALPVLLGARITTNPNETSVDFAKAARNIDDKGVSATLRGPVGDLNFVSISAYRRTRMVSGVDYDNSPLFIAHVNADQRAQSYSQEFQLLSPSDGPLQWVVGAYGFFGRAQFSPFAITSPSPDPTASATNIISAQDTRALAAFAQATLDLGHDLSVTGGLRYNVDRKEVVYELIAFPNAGFSLPFPRARTSWKNLTPKLSLQYSPGHNLFYASVSRGYKSGNYNITAPGSVPVEPEKTTAFEIGGKHTVLGGAGRFNWSAFRYDYKNLQVNIVTPGGGESLENAARERSYGADADFEVSVSRAVLARLGVAYLDAKYRDYTNASAFIPDTVTHFGNINTRVDASGNRAVRSPKLTVSANLEYIVDTPLGAWVTSGTYYYNDGFFFDANNRIKQNAYSTVNLRSQIKLSSSPVTLAVFANNLTNKRVIQGVVTAAFGDYGGYSDPRIVGVEARAEF